MPGNNYARVKYYAFKMKMKDKDLMKLNNNTTGVKKEGEFLKTKIVSFKELEKNNNASVLLGTKFVKELKLINL